MTVRALAPLTLIAALVAAGPAHAAGTYDVEPGPSAHHGLPCDVLNPCAIDWALDGTDLPSGSTVLIEAGTYDVSASPPDLTQPLTVEADPAATTVPVIQSSGAFQPVLKFDTGSDGASLSGVSVQATGQAGPALIAAVPATIDHVTVTSSTKGVVLNAAGTLSNATVTVNNAGGVGVGLDVVATATVRAVNVTVGGSGTSETGLIDEPGLTGGGQVTDTQVTSSQIGVQVGVARDQA